MRMQMLPKAINGISLPIAMAVCRRGISRVLSRPTILLPIVFMPVIMLISFTGAFGSLTRIEGYGSENIYDWMAPYVALQGSVFAGVFGSASTAADFETGFFDRLRLTPGSRSSILLGTVLVSAIRSLFPTVGVIIVALFGGLNLSGGLSAILLLAVASALMASVFCLFSLAIVYRFKTIRSLMIVQLVAFTSFFMTIGQVPLEFMTGWLHQVARFNPTTNVLRFARQGFLDGITWDLTWPGIVVFSVANIVGSVLAFHSLRRIGS